MARSVSSLTWCSMPSESMRAVAAPTPSASRKSSTIAVLAAAVLGQFPAVAGQEDGAVGLLGDEARILQPLQRLDHRGVGDAEAHGDIGAARLAALVDQVGDQFDIVPGQFRLVIGADAPERRRAEFHGPAPAFR